MITKRAQRCLNTAPSRMEDNAHAARVAPSTKQPLIGKTARFGRDDVAARTSRRPGRNKIISQPTDTGKRVHFRPDDVASRSPQQPGRNMIAQKPRIIGNTVPSGRQYSAFRLTGGSFVHDHFHALRRAAAGSP
jgi:hypothetical protein